MAVAWNPNANAPVRTIAVSGSTIYAGGEFTTIGGAARNRIAALDAATGAATSWNPSATGGNSVNAIVPSGSTIYVAGWFTNIGGKVRNHVAALNTTGGEANAWNPNASAEATALVVSGPTIYVGGWFTQIGGHAWHRLAALSRHFAISSPHDSSALDRIVRTPSLPAFLPIEQNPAHTEATFHFRLPKSQGVSLTAYDIRGRHLATLIDREERIAGTHEVSVKTEAWPAGVYFFRLESGEEVATQRMIVVR